MRRRKERNCFMSCPENVSGRPRRSRPPEGRAAGTRPIRDHTRPGRNAASGPRMVRPHRRRAVRAVPQEASRQGDAGLHAGSRIFHAAQASRQGSAALPRPETEVRTKADALPMTRGRRRRSAADLFSPAYLKRCRKKRRCSKLKNLPRKSLGRFRSFPAL